MSIILSRIDSRLLHGIVATQWAPSVAPDRLMIIDDEFANDPVKKESMRLGKPAGMALSIISREKAYANFSSHKYDGQRVFLVVRDPQIILDLLHQGEKIPKLTIGCTLIPETEAVKVSRRAYVKKEEIEIYRSIAKTGTEITVQYVPADSEEPLSKYLE
ncbi:MAG: PTS sugar transporter subunit IIB [Clostridiales bacterium]|nr:PTS sugar transporter subunit IIB [Clostridiales bacterium]